MAFLYHTQCKLFSHLLQYHLLAVVTGPQCGTVCCSAPNTQQFGLWPRLGSGWDWELVFRTVTNAIWRHCVVLQFWRHLKMSRLTWLLMRCFGCQFDKYVNVPVSTDTHAVHQDLLLHCCQLFLHVDCQAGLLLLMSLIQLIHLLHHHHHHHPLSLTMPQNCCSNKSVSNF